MIRIPVFSGGKASWFDVPDDIVVCAQGLPFDVDRYFLRSDSDLMIPLPQLTLTRARPDGITNAVTLMRQAYDGTIPRRVPISIKRDGSEKYLVMDGNSTVVIANATGWPAVPCREQS